MSYTPPSAFQSRPDAARLPSSATARPATPARKMPMMRRYEVAALLADGTTSHTHHVAPAVAEFEAAFSAFARGTLIATTKGNVAVEDLVPGDEVATLDGTSQPVIWIGSMSLISSVPAAAPHLTRLTRVTSDTFGPARPSFDLMAGPGARLLHRPAALQDGAGAHEVLTPLHELADGMGVIQITPPTPVTVYHLCLPRHAIIRAAGLHLESYHPGLGLGDGMGRNMLSLLLSLFPHVEELEDFGPLACPRASMQTLRSLSAA